MLKMDLVIKIKYILDRNLNVDDIIWVAFAATTQSLSLTENGTSY